MNQRQRLSQAKRRKKDEFYTQYVDIEAEMVRYHDYNPDVFANKILLLPCDGPDSEFVRFFRDRFEEWGLERVIATCFVDGGPGQWTTFTNGDSDLVWQDLEGDGDFRGAEVTKFRDASDLVITNPPFSLFRYFVPWLLEGDVEFSVMGNINGAGYSAIFPSFRDGRVRLGPSIKGRGTEFIVPPDYPLDAGKCRVDVNGNRYISVSVVRWFTTFDHDPNPPLKLQTMAENLQRGPKLIREHGYRRYDSCDAIEVPRVAGIPSDYDGIMGVPITFVDKHNPDQFEIVGCSPTRGGVPEGWAEDTDLELKVNGKQVYKRILIRRIQDSRNL